MKIRLVRKQDLEYQVASESVLNIVGGMKNIIGTVVGAIEKPMSVRKVSGIADQVQIEEKKPLVRLDLSPIDLDEIKKSVARAVNIRMGIKDGGSVSIAAGRVLYPAEQEERRRRILNADMHI